MKLNMNKSPTKEKERKLFIRLRDCFTPDGEEIHHRESAGIFNELGLLYKYKTSNKITLIQSAALLNAALARQPHVEKYQDDLNDLCKHVLNCANVKLKETNLAQISKQVARQVKEMRETAKDALQKVKKEFSSIITKDADQLSLEKHYVQAIKLFQFKVTKSYKQLMADISKQCSKIMGPAPCKYAVVGLGTLALEEITPYSDFKHLIILETSSHKKRKTSSSIEEYFCWYSVLFHFIVLNLQETIIPSVCIPCLNDNATPDGHWLYDSITTRGISFDGMMLHDCNLHLGRTQKAKTKPWRTELIKPVDEMVNYLEFEDLENGYKLGEILTRTCFIYGNDTIYQQLRKKVKKWLRQNKNHVVERLENHLKNFKLESSLKTFIHKGICLQQITHQLIALISALGFIYDLDEAVSTFKIIEDLKGRNIFSEYTAHRLTHAAAVSCHVRLFHCMSKKRHDDLIYEENKTWDDNDLHFLTEDIRKGCMIKSLLTTFYLQLLLKENIVIGTLQNDKNRLRDFNIPLTENEGWSKILTLIFWGSEKKVTGVGEISDTENCVALTENDVGVLQFLARTYFNTKHKPRYWEWFLNKYNLILKWIGVGRQLSLLERVEWHCFTNRTGCMLREYGWIVLLFVIWVVFIFF